MNGNNQNTPEIPEVKTVVSHEEIKSTPLSPTTTSEPMIQIKADVDMTKKPASVKETINLLNDEQLDENITQNTEGDNKKQEAESKAKTNLDDFRNKTSNTSDSTKVFNPTLAEQQSDAWVKIIDMGMRFVLKAWSGQADNVGLEVSEPDKKVLAGQLAIALNEYKVVVPIIITVLTTFGAMYATPFMNAKESKKKIDEIRETKKATDAKNNPKIKPEFDPETGKHKKGKGRFHKT